MMAVKARTGPVEPMMVTGCPENSAYTMPQIEVETSISSAPIAPWVLTLSRDPKATAGARHAKNMNSVLATHLRLRPST